MLKKHVLFGNTAEPACLYCEKARPSPDGVMVLCRKSGPVAPTYRCKKFVYDPLKRAPRRQPHLPEYDAADFTID